ncbi:sigma-70 family RNA polymerase sigma factor [Carbonactinospora thermoautotrophica]|uniref:RNA polymerase sigma factor n=1 Tax=Carbonactinospora thermoautotrophica TaxID=1469144 RepID=A0A132NK72_9ACTN|nr:sigma-70 family RNA polymerase sigma factor [Carbonactinospora thermoautotrophica]KWW97906.1 hypothetical protein TH66_21200 [Carbonactinospora thermoautotrophica]KWX10373.1 hypothetical protein TR74_04000 [Carbonactinospora thermoautotrophica]MCX9193514.1 sigma-70 family RNA polymerase sigma factor [Carbonactinospora thermoautotrophica]
MVLPPFQELVDRHWRDVARVCAALAGPNDADDVAQQAWLRALRAYPELKHARNLRGWLLSIAANAATDSHRDRARRPVPVERLPDRAVSAPEPDGDLWQRVRALPERQRIALALRYGADLTHRDIAAALGCSEAMSRRLVSDGLAALRTELGTEPHEEVRP